MSSSPPDASSGAGFPVPPGHPAGTTTAPNPQVATVAPGQQPSLGRRLKVMFGFVDPRRRWWIIALRLLVLALVPIGAVVIFGVLIFFSDFGFGLFTAAALISLLPVPFLAFWFIWLDRFDPSWWEYRLFAFGWGACVATSISLVVNTAAGQLFTRADISELWVAVWVAPVIEEITKGLAPLLLFLLWRREVVGLADAVMYAGLSATGFAMTENILYLGRVYVSGEQLQGPLGAVVGVATLIVVRLGLTGFIHPLFTAMTGFGIGMAARTGRKLLRWLYPISGLVLAMGLHGVWNFTAVLAQQNEDVRFLGYLYLMLTLPILFGFVVLTFWARSAPGRVVRRVLPEYVRAGWLSPPELGMLITLRRRLWARRWADEVAGPAGARAMRAYQVACTRLALLREGRLRGVNDWEATDSEHRLLDEIARCREVFTGRDLTVPTAWWDGWRYRITFPGGEEQEVAPQQPFAMPVPFRYSHPWHVPGYAFAGGYGSAPGPLRGQPQPVPASPGYPGWQPPGLWTAPPGYGMPPAVPPMRPPQYGQPPLPPPVPQQTWWSGGPQWSGESGPTSDPQPAAGDPQRSGDPPWTGDSAWAGGPGDSGPGASDGGSGATPDSGSGTGSDGGSGTASDSGSGASS